MQFHLLFCLSLIVQLVDGLNYPRPLALSDLIFLNNPADFAASVNGFSGVASLALREATGPFSHTAAAFTNDSYLCQKTGTDLDADILVDFTISFYLHLDPSLQKAGLFEIHDSTDSTGCYFCGAIKTTTGTDRSSEGSHFFEIEWRLPTQAPMVIDFVFNVNSPKYHFFAISANYYSYSIYHYIVGEDNGPQLAWNGFTEERKGLNSSSNQILTIGQFKKHEDPKLQMPASNDFRVFCVAIYNERLTTMEINQLPTVCQSLGQTPVNEPITSIKNLKYFNPLYSLNSLSMVESAFYLPVFGTQSTSHYQIDFPCDSSQCVMNSQPSDRTFNTIFDFPALEIPEGLVAGNYVPFTEPITNTFTIAFYLHLNPNNQANDGVLHNIFTMVYYNGSQFPIRMSFFYFNTNTTALEIQQSGGAIQMLFNDLVLSEHNFIAFNCHPTDGIHVYNIDLVSPGQPFVEIFSSSQTIAFPFKHSMFTIGGGALDESGEFLPNIWPNYMSCVFVYDTDFTIENKIRNLMQFCDNWVGAYDFVTTTTTTTAATTTTTIAESTTTAGTEDGTPTITDSTTTTNDDSILVPNSDGSVSTSTTPIWKAIPQVEITSTRITPIEKVQKECHDFDAKESAPPNRNQSTKVDLYFQVETLHYVDTVGETISIGGLLLMHWKVDTCSINDKTIFSSLGRQELLVASPDEVWTPKFKFTSSATSNIYMKGNDIGYDFMVHAFEKDGNQVLDFWYLIYGKFDSKCSMQLTQFPLDQQKCTLSFQTTAPEALVDVQSKKLYFSWAAGDNNEWKTDTQEMKSRVYSVNFGGRNVQRVEFDLVVSRIPNYYLLNLTE